jgi:hypothetical protein
MSLTASLIAGSLAELIVTSRVTLDPAGAVDLTVTFAVITNTAPVDWLGVV